MAGPVKKGSAADHQRVWTGDKVPKAPGMSIDPDIIICPEGSAAIPGGMFWMGSYGGNPDEAPPHLVVVSPFCLQKSEITNREYEPFRQRLIKAGEPRAPLWLREKFMRPDQPAVLMKWRHADAYCRSIGGRLPTEAEWEYAARGGWRQLAYGTASGNLLLPGEAHYSDAATAAAEVCVHDVDAFGRCGGARGTADVCTHGMNVFGLCDMAGNVDEWTADTLRSYWNPEVDEFDHDVRVFRGGSWWGWEDGLRATSRNYDYYPAEIWPSSIGARCVVPEVSPADVK